MPQELNQDPNQKDADISAATLSFATNLSQQMMPKAPQPQETGATSDSNQKGEEIPVEQKEETSETTKDTYKEEMGTKMAEVDDKIENLRKEIKETIKEEISTIKESIKEALEENE